MLYLSDVSSTDLSSILDYIYLGEAQIFQEGIDNFLTNAQKLKLEGLLQTEEGTGESPEVHHEDNTFKTENPILPSTEINTTNRRSKTSNQPQLRTIQKVSLNGNMDFKELEQKIQEMTETDGDKCICRHCGKVATGRNRKQDLANHIETHIDALSFSCQLCDNTYSLQV